jgi:hypothetical protein
MFRDYGIDAIGINLSPNMAAEAGRRQSTPQAHLIARRR